MKEFILKYAPRVLFDLFLVVSTVSTIGIICFFAYLSFVSLYDYQPVRVDRIDLSKTEARRGEEVCLKFAGEKLMPVPVQVSIDLVDGVSTNIMHYSSNIPPGTEFPSRCFVVPYNARLGKNHIQWTGVYRINFIRNVERVMRSSPLTILPALGERGEKGEQGMQGEHGERGAKGDPGKGITLFGK